VKFKKDGRRLPNWQVWFIKMIRTEEVKILEREFDRMDYNNQRNVLWEMEEIARTREEGKDYDWKKFSYQNDKHFFTICENVAPVIGSDKLTQMALKLTDIGRATKLKDLIEAA